MRVLLQYWLQGDVVLISVSSRLSSWRDIRRSLIKAGDGALPIGSFSEVVLNDEELEQQVTAEGTIFISQAQVEKCVAFPET